MTTRHLIIRVSEHLNLSDQNGKSAIKDHINACVKCKNANIDVNSFTTLKSCRNEYLSKIYEALLIRKHSPKLNRQLYANGSSFLLNVY